MRLQFVPIIIKGHTWVPEGQTPVVESKGTRFSLNMLSAVNSQGEFRFMLHEGNVTADTFCNFIISLTKSVNKNVFLVVDGYRIYHPKKVNALIEKLNGKMTLLFLQPYSLQLNPSFYGVISSSTSVKNTFKTKEN